MLRPADARRLEIEDNETLLDLLEEKGVVKNADTTGDGDEDGWKFEFRSTKSIGIAFEGDPRPIGANSRQLCLASIAYRRRRSNQYDE